MTEKEILAVQAKLSQQQPIQIFSARDELKKSIVIGLSGNSRVIAVREQRTPNRCVNVGFKVESV